MTEEKVNLDLLCPGCLEYTCVYVSVGWFGDVYCPSCRTEIRHTWCRECGNGVTTTTGVDCKLCQPCWRSANAGVCPTCHQTR